jgi:hypothetical protein
MCLIRLPLFKEFMLNRTAEQLSNAGSQYGSAMTPEMIQQAANSGTIFGLAALPLGSLFGWLITTLIFFAVIKIGGGQGRFKHYLSVTGYSYVISTVYILLILIMSFFTNSLYMEAPLTSLASVLNPDTSAPWMYGLAKGIDLFTIWQYVVTAIGLTVVSKFKRKWVCYLIVAIFFVLSISVTAVAAAVTSSLT